MEELRAGDIFKTTQYSFSSCQEAVNLNTSFTHEEADFFICIFFWTEAAYKPQLQSSALKGQCYVFHPHTATNCLTFTFSEKAVYMLNIT